MNPKAVALAQRIIQLASERRLSMGATRLVKLMYLAEVEFYQDSSTRLTDLRWRFHFYGPYPDEFHTIEQSPLFQHEEISLTNNRTLRNFMPDEFAQDQAESLAFREEQAVFSVVSDWADADLNMLLSYVYFETEPMLEAQPGQLLDFSLIRPRPKPIHLMLDKGKLRKLQENLKDKAAAYSDLRVAHIVPEESRAPIRAWADEMQLRLSPGRCSSDLGRKQK